MGISEELQALPEGRWLWESWGGGRGCKAVSLTTVMWEWSRNEGGWGSEDVNEDTQLVSRYEVCCCTQPSANPREGKAGWAQHRGGSGWVDSPPPASPGARVQCSHSTHTWPRWQPLAPGRHRAPHQPCTHLHQASTGPATPEASWPHGGGGVLGTRRLGSRVLTLPLQSPPCTSLLPSPSHAPWPSAPTRGRASKPAPQCSPLHKQLVLGHSLPFPWDLFCQAKLLQE